MSSKPIPPICLLTDDDWHRIETASGKKLNETRRSEIIEITHEMIVSIAMDQEADTWRATQTILKKARASSRKLLRLMDAKDDVEGSIWAINRLINSLQDPCLGVIGDPPSYDPLQGFRQVLRSFEKAVIAALRPGEDDRFATRVGYAHMAWTRRLADMIFDGDTARGYKARLSATMRLLEEPYLRPGLLNKTSKEAHRKAVERALADRRRETLTASD